MNVKKLTVALAATAASAALASGDANAYTVAINDNGLLVSHAVHNGLTDTTAVGLISRAAGTVYWTFFDCDSQHITDGHFPVTADDMYSFIWANEAGVGLEGMHGYLVFSLDTNADVLITAADSPALAGNAYQVNATLSDVAFVPTLPLNNVDYVFAAGTDLTTMDDNTTAGISNSGVATGDRIDMRYYIDGAVGGTDTTILVWSAADIRGTYTVNMFNDKQDRKSVNFGLDCAELNVFNPEAIVGRPAAYLDGFIAWNVPAPVFVYSLVYAPAFGATQTMLATH